MEIYNTLGRKKMRFRSIRKGKVGMYTCGPTVYEHAHIGNFRAYIFADLLKRVLTYEGYSVTHVMNITDVGQLVGDGNIGEDKVRLTARLQHKTAKQVASEYERIFLKDMDSLEIIRPDVIARATDHVPEMLAIIHDLDSKGYTYKIGTGIYFDTSKFKDYGNLIGTTFKRLNESLRAGARVERPAGERNITDFVVWRFSKPEDKEMVWGSEYGKGFPGWHIECSAISMKYLGSHFDIHTGGVDHIPVHHPNEIAQSESYTGKKFVNYWMHSEFLKVNGRKMSKSLHNIYTIEDLAEKGFSQFDYKYFIISGHYRKIQNFAFDALANSKNTLAGMYKWVERLSVTSRRKGDDDSDPAFARSLRSHTATFFDSMGSDLDTPGALSHLHAFISAANHKSEDTGISPSDSRTTIKLLLEMDGVLGLQFGKHTSRKNIPREAISLIKKRERAREGNDFKEADLIRNELRERFGISVEDTDKGTEWTFL